MTFGKGELPDRGDVKFGMVNINHLHKVLAQCSLGRAIKATLALDTDRSKVGAS